MNKMKGLSCAMSSKDFIINSIMKEAVSSVTPKQLLETMLNYPALHKADKKQKKAIISMDVVDMYEFVMLVDKTKDSVLK